MSEPDFQEVDLLGDPVPPNFKGRGRPQHVPTAETWLKVNLLWAMEAKNSECAKALGISEPTFNRHYFNRSLRKEAREMARWKVKAENLANLKKAADSGNVAAMKEIQAMFERLELRERAEKLAGMRQQTTDDQQPKGKKEQQAAAAQQVGGKFAPPQPPLMKH